MLNFTAKRYKRSDFTLIEMLAVLGILAILTFVALPAFESLAKGHGTVLAARNIGAKLKAVRSYAITKRQYVALLMPQIDLASTVNEYPAKSESGISDDYYNRSYRACIVTKNGNNYEFQRWIEGEKWNYLPKGVAFLEADNDDTVNLDSGKLSPENAGTISLVDKVDYSDIDGIDIADASSDDKRTAAVIFKSTGKSTASNAIYLEIGMGKVSGGALVLTKTEDNSYQSIKVDQFSGRISYGTE